MSSTRDDVDRDDFDEEELRAEAARSRLAPGDGRGLGYWLVLASLVGIFASGMLDYEKISYWEQKATGLAPSLGCNINPIVGCGNVINTREGSLLFNIPNPVPGLVAFGILLTLGALLVARVGLPGWVWTALQVGVTVGIGVVTFLQYDSIHVLGALCPYCMVIWAVMIPTFWLVTARNLRRWAPENGIARFVADWVLLFIALHFIAVLSAIWFTFGSKLWA